MSDTTLRVFDQGGMYQESALATNSVVVDRHGSGAELYSPFVEHGTQQDIAPRSAVAVADESIDFPPTLSDIEKMLDAHPAGLSKAFAQWLVRICRASDARIVQLEDEVKLKQSDFNGLVSEWQDLADENRRLKQQAEVDRVVCDSQERTILELQAQIEDLQQSVADYRT